MKHHLLSEEGEPCSLVLKPWTRTHTHTHTHTAGIACLQLRIPGSETACCSSSLPAQRSLLWFHCTQRVTHLLADSCWLRWTSPASDTPKQAIVHHEYRNRTSYAKAMAGLQQLQQNILWMCDSGLRRHVLFPESRALNLGSRGGSAYRLRWSPGGGRSGVWARGGLDDVLSAFALWLVRIHRPRRQSCVASCTDSLASGTSCMLASLQALDERPTVSWIHL